MRVVYICCVDYGVSSGEGGRTCFWEERSMPGLCRLKTQSDEVIRAIVLEDSPYLLRGLRGGPEDPVRRGRGERVRLGPGRAGELMRANPEVIRAIWCAGSAWCHNPR